MRLSQGHDPAFITRLSEQLYPVPPAVEKHIHGDHVLNDALPQKQLIRPAAVLVPLIAREGSGGTNYTMVLTQRAASLRQHAAQISFPGGKIDPADPSPLAAALREANEEIGLSASSVQPIGYLDSYLSATGYSIIPVVGLVDSLFSPRPNPEEVEDVFEVPLDFLMNTDHHERHAREWGGVLRHYYAMSYGKRYIWGATAGIIRNLYERLYAL